MEIQINSRPLCSVASSSMPDVYNVLGKYSISFHLDQDKECLNIVSSVQGIQIVFENECPESTSLLDKIRNELAVSGFYVYIVEDEEERKRCLSQLDEEKQRIWISILQGESKGNGVTAYFSFHQMKSSKQFAQLLLQNIAKMTDLPVNGVMFEWKNIINSIFPLSGPLQQMPTIGVAFSGLASLSERHIERLAKSMIRTIFSFFNQQDLFEVIQYVLAHRINMSDAHQTPAEQERAPELAYTLVFDQESEAEDEQQDQVKEKAQVQVQKQEKEKNHEQVAAFNSQLPHHSTFSWLYLHTVKKDGQSAGGGARTATSFISYVNKLEQAKNPNAETNEQQQVNLLARNRNKSHDP